MNKRDKDPCPQGASVLAGRRDTHGRESDKGRPHGEVDNEEVGLVDILRKSKVSKAGTFL